MSDPLQRGNMGVESHHYVWMYARYSEAVVPDVPEQTFDGAECACVRKTLGKENNAVIVKDISKSSNWISYKDNKYSNMLLSLILNICLIIEA